ncbi:hypothetical protein C1H46_015669 [Malus baccata]|uniref:Protein kinase domain-containing protein n=1 Tax=Malus baccata TaxID=106549 RepID=A0A540MIZ5_MALBA|nr:hypothetical protein C1H46_015669 [Malus baccata]
MATSCFHALRLRKSKSKPLPNPSSSKKSQFNSEMNSLERKRFDSMESWSMILDSENVETWEVSKEDQEEWTADLSQLFIGNKFASGAHSRIYRGIYKQRAVAVKMVRIPNQREETRSLLEQQFKSEVALLSRLFHPNIVQRPDFCDIVSALEKYDECVKEGLPLTHHSGLVSRNVILERLKGCVSLRSSVTVQA